MADIWMSIFNMTMSFCGIFFLIWYVVLKGLLHPFTVIVIRNRSKMKFSERDKAKMEKSKEKELAVIKEALGEEKDPKEIKKVLTGLNLDNFEILNLKARIGFSKGVKGFKFLFQKGFAQVAPSTKLYPVRNFMRQEVAAILYTEDNVHYQYVAIGLNGKLTTLDQDDEAYMEEELKQIPKRWETNKTMQLIVNAIPLMTIVMCGIGAYIFMQQMLPDMISQAASASSNHIQTMADAIRSTGIECVCNC